MDSGNSWAAVFLGIATLAGLLIYLRRKTNAEAKPESCPKRILRPLGTTESFFYTFGHHGCMLLINILFLKSKKQVRIAEVSEALKRIMGIHPLLNAGVRRHRGECVFVQLDEETEVPVEVDESDNWQEVFENQCHAKLERDGLLWKVLFLPNVRLSEIQAESSSNQSAVIFLFNHAIIDGTSYMRLFNTFLDVLTEILEGQPTLKEPLPLLSSMDDFVKPYFTIWDHLISVIMRLVFSIPPLKTFLMRKLMSFKNIYIDTFSQEIENLKNVKPKNSVFPIILSKTSTKNLLIKGRENKATVQGAIQAASMIAAAKLWKRSNSKIEQLRMETEITINIRASFEEEIPPESLGLFIGRMTYIDDVNISDDTDCQEFWQLAKKITTDLHARLKQKEYLNETKHMLSMKSVVGNLDDMMVQMMKQNMLQSHGRSPPLLTYSNMGNCSFLNRPSGSPVEIIGRFGMSTQHIIGSIFYNNLATINGQLFWNVAYPSHVVSKSIAHEFVDNIHEVLNTALNIK